ncbi:MAG TPA: co-chaperone GroES [Armatimonadetes bacterium]|nr:co-chaperone GroES [Armatimonadota bacterium]
MTLKPLGDRVVVEVLEEEEKTAGGIVLPETAQQKPQEGKVLAVGPGKVLENGQRVPLEVKVGDRIIFSKYGGTEVTLEGKDYLILDSDSILAVRTDTKKKKCAGKK